MSEQTAQVATPVNEVVNAGGGILVDTGSPAVPAKATVKKAAVKKAATPAKASGKKAPAPAKKAASKKAATKKAPAKTAPSKKAEKAPAAKKDGLRKPQVRILQTLVKSAKPLTRPQIAEKADVDVATLPSYLGSHDQSIREKNDKRKFVSLLTLGLVKSEVTDVEGRNTTVYSVTAKGKAEAAKADKE